MKQGLISEQRQAANDSKEIVVSGYDRTSVFLASAILVVGFCVAILFAIWVTWEAREIDTIIKVKPLPPTELDQSKDPNESKLFPLTSDQPDWIEAGEEIAENETPELEKMLLAVTDVTSNVLAKNSLGVGEVSACNHGTGGPGSDRSDRPPVVEYKRWLVEFDVENLDAYKRQLDFFDLQIGVVEKSTNQIFRVSQLSSTAKVTETNRAAENTTLRFEQQQLQLRRWDQKIARDAGVDLSDAFTCLLYPKATREIMRQVEADYVKQQQKQLDDVQSSVFQLIPEGDEGFKIQVKQMRFRL